MKQLKKKVSRFFVNNELLVYAGVCLGGLCGAVFLLLGLLTRCEEVKRIEVNATTMPSREAPRVTVVRQKALVNSILRGYVESMEQLAVERVQWLKDSMEADIQIKQAARQGIEEDIKKWAEKRKELKEKGEELDALSFLYNASLDRIRLQVVTDFDEMYPGWWLMVEESK